jgi:hypothetical protein
VTQNKLKLRALSSAERELLGRQFVLPNPGDMIIMLVFSWAFLCFFLVTLGDRLLIKLVKLARNEAVRAALLESDQVLGALMVGGSVALILAVVIYNKFPRLFLVVIIFSAAFGNATWKPLHDVSLICKYLGVIYLAAYAAQSLYKNIWRFSSIPFIRLIMAWLIWVAFVCIFIGGKQADFWYLGSEVTFLLGFAITWLYAFNNKYGLKEFNHIVALAALVTTAMHLLAPVLADPFMVNGRFVSFHGRATGFSVAMAPLVVTMFWRAMEEKDVRISSFFAAAALVGYALILWSASRSPSAATLIGVCILWWYFRSRLLLVMLLMAVLGVIGQLVLSGFTGDIAQIIDRVEDVNASEGGGRLDLWIVYIQVAAGSPVYGFAPSGLSFAIVGGALGDFLASRGVEVDIRGIHNSFLGITMRFGLVGLTCFLAILVPAMIRAFQVLRSKKIPDIEKRMYILPAALMPVICFTILFEDSIPGSGKGTVMQLLLYASIVICHTYGSKLVNLYERMDGKSKLIHTVDGLKVASQPSVNT